MSYLLATRDAVEQAIRDLFPAMVPAQIVAEWLVAIDREKLTTAEIHVGPYHRNVTNVARGMLKQELKFVVMYAQPIGTDPDAAIEAGQVVAETLEQLISKKMNGFICTLIEQPMVFDKAELTKSSAANTTILIHLEKASL